LAPGATFGPTKRWRASHYAVLAQLVSQHHALRCVVVGGPDPQEQALCATVAKQAGGVSVAGATDLVTLAALLHEAAAFVGNDSGPMHLAAAVGVPTLGIFGSTSPGWTAPRGRVARAFGPHPVPCTPCFRSTCPIGLPCLEQLAPQAAFEVLSSMLGVGARPSGGAAS
jgi:heptosyltransferase-2